MLNRSQRNPLCITACSIYHTRKEQLRRETKNSKKSQCNLGIGRALPPICYIVQLHFHKKNLPVALRRLGPQSIQFFGPNRLPPTTKRHLDRFSRFFQNSRSLPTDRPINRHTDRQSEWGTRPAPTAASLAVTLRRG